jgi:hypothetical protein
MADDVRTEANLVVAVLIADGVTASDAVNPAEALSMITGWSGASWAGVNFPPW